MSLADDFNSLRQRGVPDDQIIDAYKAYQPAQADDINNLLKKGEKPATIVDALGAFDSQQNSQAPVMNLTGAFRHGLAENLRGDSTTGKVFAPNTGTVGGVAQQAEGALDGVAGTVDDPNYVPAAKTMGPNSTWSQWASSIPNSLAETAGKYSQDIGAGLGGAAVGGPFGAAAGFLGSHFLDSTGDHAVANAQARGVNVDLNDPNSQPSTSDKARAGLQSGLESAAALVGGGGVGSGVVKVGESLLSTLAAQIGTNVAKDAALSAGTSLGDQLLTPGSKIDPNELLNAGVLGGAGGAIAHSLGAVKDVNTARATSDIDPQSGQNIADRLAQQQLGSPSDNFKAVDAVQGDIASQAKSFASDPGLKAQLKDLDVASGFKDDTGMVVNRALDAVQSGRPVSSDDLQTITGRLGDKFDGANLVSALTDHNTLQQVKALGQYDPSSQTFGGGMANNPFVQTWVKPSGSGAKMEDLAGAALGGHALMAAHGLVSPWTALAPEIGQMGLYSALRGVDRLTGASDPLGNFVDRFSSSDQPATPNIMEQNQDKPSLLQEQAEAKAAADEAAARQKAQAGQQRTQDQAQKQSFSDYKTLQRIKTNSTSNEQAAQARQQSGDARAQKAQAQQDAQDQAAAAKQQANEMAAMKAKLKLVMSSKALEAKQGAQQDAADAQSTADALRQAKYLQMVRSNSDAQAAPPPKAANAEPAPTPFGQRESNDVPGMSNQALAKTKTMIKALSRQAEARSDKSASSLKPAKEPARGKVMGRGGVGAERAPKVASEAPRSRKAKSEGIEQNTVAGDKYVHDAKADTISVTHQAHTVERPTAGVNDVPRYAAKTLDNLKTRQAAFDQAKALVSTPHDAAALDNLHQAYNQNHSNSTVAYHHMEDVVNSLDAPDDVKGKVMDHVFSPRVQATWKDK